MARIRVQAEKVGRARAQEFNFVGGKLWEMRAEHVLHRLGISPFVDGVLRTCAHKVVDSGKFMSESELTANQPEINQVRECRENFGKSQSH